MEIKKELHGAKCCLAFSAARKARQDFLEEAWAGAEQRGWCQRIGGWQVEPAGQGNSGSRVGEGEKPPGSDLECQGVEPCGPQLAAT